MSKFPQELYDLEGILRQTVDDMFPVAEATHFLTEPCHGHLIYRFYPKRYTGLQVRISCDDESWLLTLILFLSRNREIADISLRKGPLDTSEFKQVLEGWRELLEKDF